MERAGRLITRRPRVLVFVGRRPIDGAFPPGVGDYIAGHDPAAVDLHLATWGVPMASDGGDPLRRHAHLHPLEGDGAACAALGPLGASVRLAALAARLRPDIVHLHSGTHQVGLGALTGRGAKLVFEVHDGPSAGRWSAPATVLARTLARRHSTTVVVHSARVRADVAWRWGVDAVLIPETLVVDLTDGSRAAQPDAPLVLAGGPARRGTLTPVLDTTRVRSAAPEPVSALTDVYQRLVSIGPEAR